MTKAKVKIKELSPEELVIEYMKIHRGSPLRFSIESFNPFGTWRETNVITPESKPDCEVMNIEKMVLWVLRECRLRSSLYKIGTTQCRRSANRSSFDIWRHVLFFNPDASLMEVMRKLCVVYEKGLCSSLFCPGIRKRVFHSSLPSGPMSIQSANSHIDEYGLYFKQWKEVGL